jgi:hypothetical protein
MMGIIVPCAQLCACIISKKNPTRGSRTENGGGGRKRRGEKGKERKKRKGERKDSYSRIPIAEP